MSDMIDERPREPLRSVGDGGEEEEGGDEVLSCDGRDQSHGGGRSPPRRSRRAAPRSVAARHSSRVSSLGNGDPREGPDPAREERHDAERHASASTLNEPPTGIPPLKRPSACGTPAGVSPTAGLVRSAHGLMEPRRHDADRLDTNCPCATPKESWFATRRRISRGLLRSHGLVHATSRRSRTWPLLQGCAALWGASESAMPARRSSSVRSPRLPSKRRSRVHGAPASWEAATGTSRDLCACTSNRDSVGAPSSHPTRRA